MKISEDYQENIKIVQQIFNDLCNKHNITTKFEAHAENPCDGCGVIYIYPTTDDPSIETPGFCTLGSACEIRSCQDIEEDEEIFYMKDEFFAYTDEDGEEAEFPETEEELINLMKGFDND